MLGEKSVQITVIGGTQEITLSTNNVIVAELADFGVVSYDESTRKHTLHLADAKEFDKVVFLIKFNS